MRRIGMVDLDTGELLEGVNVATFRPRLKIKERYMLLFQDAFQKLAADREIRGETLRVLMALIAKLDFDNYLNFSQRQLAREMNLHQPAVARGMQQLIERGLVLKGPPGENKRSTYRLSHNLAWRGRVRSLEEARQKRRREVQPVSDE